MSEARDERFIEKNRQDTERLRKLGYYHSIELPDGSVIEGLQSVEQMRRRLRMFPIPDDLTGRRVLDIGAWDGWFSFEMERRGAEVMALDYAKNTRFLQARKLLGSRVEYRIGDICRLTSKDLGTFDIVLFLGVLYHLKHPLMALENVCGMCRDLACIESYVTDADPNGIPLMEFYEGAELRGQLDNWVGPNSGCLMAFCRTAGFARVEFAGALAERGHVTAYRDWLPASGSARAPASGTAKAPAILCIGNAETHDHQFSVGADDYASFYFASDEADLTCDNVMPRIGPYGSRPLHVGGAAGGWQATCKIPPGLEPGWHDAVLRTAASAFSAPVRLGIDMDQETRQRTGRLSATGNLRLTSVADGKCFEAGRIRVGTDSAITAWAVGVPSDMALEEIRLRLDGTDLPAIWIQPGSEDAPRQINALLPVGLGAGLAEVVVVAGSRVSEPTEVLLYSS